jgi:hypothetical protein
LGQNTPKYLVGIAARIIPRQGEIGGCVFGWSAGLSNRMMNKPRPLPLRWDEIEEVFKGWRQYAAADKKMNDMWTSLLEDLRTHAESKRLISAAT